MFNMFTLELRGWAWLRLTCLHWNCGVGVVMFNMFTLELRGGRGYV